MREALRLPWCILHLHTAYQLLLFGSKKYAHIPRLRGYAPSRHPIEVCRARPLSRGPVDARTEWLELQVSASQDAAINPELLQRQAQPTGASYFDEIASSMRSSLRRRGPPATSR